MAATFQWSESNTLNETVHDGITNLNTGNNDSYNLNVSTYPVTRGNASFEKYIRAKFSDTFTEISNMKFWKSNGELVGGETIKAAANVAFATPSATPNGDDNIPIGESGDDVLTIQSAAGTPTITAPGYTKYIRIQTQTTVSTPSGSVNQKTYTFQYDEV